MDAGLSVALIMAIAALVVINGAASLAVWKSRLYTREQCRNQLVIIWLLPLVGALIVLVALRSAREDARSHRLLKHNLDDQRDSFSQRSAADDD